MNQVECEGPLFRRPIFMTSVVLKNASKKEKDLNHWTDLWFAPDKKAGFAIIANENYYNQHVIGYNNRNQARKIAKMKVDKYISLNAFDVEDFKNLKHVRSAKNLKQIRMIGIDIDQYNCKLSILEAQDEIFKLIDNGDIPEPNLVLKSRGIQLFYSLKGGLSPNRTLLATYITEQIIKKLAHIGADANAKDMARLMRLPESYNSRNGSRVHWEIWNKSSYSTWELLKFLPNYKPKQTKITTSTKVLNLNWQTQFMLRTNAARLHDFNKLISLRNGDFTGLRNILMYNYSFHLSLLERDYNTVLNTIHKVFSKIKTKDKKQGALSETEINLTVRSAFDGAEEFLNYYAKNDYKIDIVAADGVIKPKLTETIIQELSITSEEQKHMRTLAYSPILNQNRNKRKHETITKQRREKGIRTMEEYNNERKSKKQDNIQKLKQLLDKHPEYTQQQYAELLGINRATVSRYIKLL